MGKNTIHQYGRRLKAKKSSGVAIARKPDERLVVLVQGIQFLNSALAANEKIPESLIDKFEKNRYKSLIKIDTVGSDTRFFNNLQNVRYTIRVLDKKSELKQYLEAPNVMVIYDGHARYGRGPCFGPSDGKGEDWGDGSIYKQSVNGIFRMGYRYLGIPVSEVLHHGYHAWVAPDSEPINDHVKTKIKDLHPWLRTRRKKNRIIALTLDEITNHLKGIEKDAKAYLNQNPSNKLHSGDIKDLLDENLNDIKTLVAGGHASRQKFWCYYKNAKLKYKNSRGESKYQYFKLIRFVVKADWENTTVAPMDLGKTNMACKVFCHFGCSTYLHHSKIVRHAEHKNWKFKNNNGYLYLTTASSLESTPYWLYHLIRYRRFNAYKSWSGVLRFAMKQTNKKLADLQKQDPKNYNYRIKYVPSK